MKLVIVLCFFVLLNGLCESFEDDCMVETLNGVVLGTKGRTKVKNKPYYAFRGVPFAKPPVGELRFEAPQPPDDWAGILDATNQKNICPQAAPVETASIIMGSEDCLYLNIYTPIPPKQAYWRKPLAVMVWIHGGAFITGDTTYELFAPDFLLNEDVIFVAIPYRLEFLGFFSTGDMVAPGNNALRDQIRGLTWIKENIRRFGGDPEEITIFGESAGGASVSHLTQTPLARGLYKRAIMQSGVSHMTWAISETSLKTAYNTAELLGIDAISSEDLKRKLKKVNYKELCAMSNIAGNRILWQFPLGGFPNGPVIEPEHPAAIIFKPPMEALRSRDINPTPMMIGFNSMEAIGLSFACKIIPYLNKGKLSSESLVPNGFGITDLNELKQLGDEIKIHYFGNLSNVAFTDEQFIRYISDVLFGIRNLEAAELLSKQTDVFLYELSYLGDLGNPNRPYNFGVGHTEDLNYLFWRISNPLILNATDVKVRQRIVRLWTNFAKTGNPTPRKEPLLQNIIWPKVDENLTYLNIDADLLIGERPHEADYKFWTQLFDKFRKY